MPPAGSRFLARRPRYAGLISLGTDRDMAKSPFRRHPYPVTPIMAIFMDKRRFDSRPPKRPRGRPAAFCGFYTRRYLDKVSLKRNLSCGSTDTRYQEMEQNNHARLQTRRSQNGKTYTDRELSVGIYGAASVAEETNTGRRTTERETKPPRNGQR